jgi:hypothetical protein
MCAFSDEAAQSNRDDGARDTGMMAPKRPASGGWICGTEQPWDTLLEHRVIVSTSLMAHRASNPTLADLPARSPQSYFCALHLLRCVL